MVTFICKCFTFFKKKALALRKDLVMQVRSSLSIFIFYYWAVTLHKRPGICHKLHLKSEFSFLVVNSYIIVMTKVNSLSIILDS